MVTLRGALDLVAPLWQSRATTPFPSVCAQGEAARAGAGSSKTVSAAASAAASTPFCPEDQAMSIGSAAPPEPQTSGRSYERGFYAPARRRSPRPCAVYAALAERSCEELAQSLGLALQIELALGECAAAFAHGFAVWACQEGSDRLRERAAVAGRVEGAPLRSHDFWVPDRIAGHDGHAQRERFLHDHRDPVPRAIASDDRRCHEQGRAF